MQKLIIDTDIGDDVDDAIAIAYALKRKELDILAITAVTGPTGARCNLIRGLTRAMGREDVAVSAGMKLPMRPFSPEERARFFTPGGYVLNQCSEADLVTPWEGHDDAPGMIVSLANRYPGEVGLACIGPMTNAAAAFMRDPDLGRKLKFVYCMGGETGLNRREHNVAFDAAAARVVLAGGALVALGTWDVTRRFVLSESDCRKIAGMGAAGACVAEMAARWWPHKGHKPGPVMYDIFPIIHAEMPGLYKTAPMRVVIPAEGPAEGMTIAAPGEPNAAVSVDIDADAVRALYFETMGG